MVLFFYLLQLVKLELLIDIDSNIHRKSSWLSDSYKKISMQYSDTDNYQVMIRNNLKSTIFLMIKIRISHMITQYSMNLVIDSTDRIF